MIIFMFTHYPNRSNGQPGKYKNWPFFIDSETGECPWSKEEQSTYGNKILKEEYVKRLRKDGIRFQCHYDGTVTILEGQQRKRYNGKFTFL